MLRASGEQVVWNVAISGGSGRQKRHSIGVTGKGVKGNGLGIESPAGNLFLYLANTIVHG
jgi:hypothetical protein